MEMTNEEDNEKTEKPEDNNENDNDVKEENEGNILIVWPVAMIWKEMTNQYSDKDSNVYEDR